MKGRLGTPSIYHRRLPEQWKLERMMCDALSKEARMRLRWIDHYKKNKNARLTCRYYGISPTTFYRWLRRFTERGLRGLESLSRAPMRRRVSQVPREHVALVVDIRKAYPEWSKHKIAVILSRDHGVSLSASTVGRILKRKGLYEKKKSLKRKRAAQKRAKKMRAERWMRDLYPGSLVQIDTKHLRFAGQRYYQFTATDCFTRMSFIRISMGASSRAGREFFSRLVEFLPFPIEGVQTDNGSEYEKEFRKALQDKGVDQYFTYPNCPQQNARVERKIQTSEVEFWNHHAAYTVEDLNELANEWNHTYNEVRPHQSLGYLTPAEFLTEWYERSKQREKVSTM